ncbi:MAG: alpha/beta hydrolase [Alphaproteobacteria bacterium]
MNILQGHGFAEPALRDVIYGPFPRNRLDVYPPGPMEGKAPVVLFFHGGSWRKGDKRLYRWLGRALAWRGFLAVIPNYRLFPHAAFPVFMEDAAMAVAWTRTHAPLYGGDPGRIHVMGHSAGAYMVTLLGLDADYLQAAALSPSDLCSVIGISGPYSMDPLADEDVRPVFEGTPDLERVKPINFVNGEAPPMLLLHGGRDVLVPARQADLLHGALTELGGAARKVVYPALGHIEIVLTLTPFYRWRAPVLSDVVEFLRAPEGAEGAGIAEALSLSPSFTQECAALPADAGPTPHRAGRRWPP